VEDGSSVAFERGRRFCHASGRLMIGIVLLTVTLTSALAWFGPMVPGVLSGANSVSDPSREGIHVLVNRPAEHVDRVPEQRYHPVAVGLKNAFRV
jgi:hypothetical protein